MRWIEVTTRVDNEAVEAVAEVFQRYVHGGVVIDYATEPGQEISPEFYEAVAEVLAYVYRMEEAAA